MSGKQPPFVGIMPCWFSNRNMTIRSAFLRKISSVPTSSSILISCFRVYKYFCLNSTWSFFWHPQPSFLPTGFCWVYLPSFSQIQKGQRLSHSLFCHPIHFLRDRRSRDLKLQGHYLGQSRRATYSPWSICLLGLLSFFAFFTEERLSFMWSVLNHFCIFWMELQHWLDEPNSWGIPLLSACPLRRYVSNKDIVVRNVSGFCESVSPGWLGCIWHFASLIHAHISELNFQWWEGDNTSSQEK